METQIMIQEAFRIYDRKMTRIYQELNSIKESCSYKEGQLLMEGFWDVLKKASGGVGSFLGKTTQKVSNFSNDVYDKGIELGKKAIDVGRELVNKVSEVTRNAVASIKSAPGRLFDACKDIYASISNEVGEIYKKAKEKGGEFLNNAKTTIINIYSKVAANLSEGISSFKNWAQNNADAFKRMTEEKKAELLEAAKSAENSANETIKKIGMQIRSFYEKGKDVSKNVGLFAIGLVVMPFYASYLLAKKTYELGEDAVNIIGSGIESIKKSVPEIWNEFQSNIREVGSEFGKSYQAGRESEKRPTEESYIFKTFESFIQKRY